MGGEPLLAEPLGTLPSFPWSSWRQLASSSGRGWRGTPFPWTGVQEGLDPPPAPLSTQPSIPNGPKEQLCSAAQPPTPLAQLPPTLEGAGVKRLCIHPKWTCLRGQGFSSWSGNFHMLRSTKSLGSATTEPALWSLWAATTEARAPTAGVATRETRARRSPHPQPSAAPARLNRRKSARSTEDPAQSKLNK